MVLLTSNVGGSKEMLALAFVAFAKMCLATWKMSHAEVPQMKEEVSSVRQVACVL